VIKRTRLLVLTVALLSAAGAAFGHFHTFWPDSPNGYGQLGRPTQWRYFWGHPYEVIIFDAEPPVVYAVTPDGERAEVAVRPVETEDPDTGEARRAFTFEYTPQVLGDTWLVVEAPAYAIEEEGEAVQDCVKQCVHVMAEDGWEARLGLPIEVVPLTRPYGLEAGFAFTARAYLDGEPLADAPVEIEKFNGSYVAADELPTDQFGNEDVPMITRAARTDADGYVTYTLDEPGWWMISVSAEAGTVQAAGEELPRVLRGGLWVNVQEPFTVGG
jgi:cobalt/nickel transport protein